MLVGAKQIFGDDPRIRRLIDANEAERDVGSPSQRLQQRDRSRPVEGTHQAERQRVPSRGFPEQIFRSVRLVDDAAGHRVELFGLSALPD